MVILYNRVSNIPLVDIKKQKQPYKAKQRKIKFSSRFNVRPLTAENKSFLRSLGLKVLI